MVYTYAIIVSPHKTTMQLHHNPASPFVRKVMALAIETGLDSRLNLVTAAITPVNPSDAVIRDNPLGKIPALVLDDGSTLFDSRVICEYLDSLHDGPKFFPAQGPERWTALCRQALADGIMDAGVTLRYETFLRPEALRWEEWIHHQQQKCFRACDQLEAQAQGFSNTLDIGTLSVGCALGYLDLRFPEWGWREGRPALTTWFEEFSQRPGMAGTVPA